VKGKAPPSRIFLLAALALPAFAQQSPHAGYVYPAGGKRGATVEVRVGGQFLNGAQRAYVSGGGVEARVIEYDRPLTGAAALKLRDEMQQLNQKRRAGKLTAAEEHRAAEIRDKLEDVQRRPSIPAIAEIVSVEITIAPDAAPGPRQLRIDGNNGLTNPIIFCVGELPEFARKPSRVAPAYNAVNGATPVTRLVARPPDPPADVALPVVVNGQMMPGTTDQYRFRANKGEHLVIAVAARELMPYISDAVPGWFQAALTLRDAEGRELVSADHYLFHPDPLIEYDVPADGQYIAEIHDSIFRGREDFVYRVSMGELPVITSVFPLGAQAGKRAAVETHGWNLPAAHVTENRKGKQAEVISISQQLGGYTSNTVPFAIGTLPETTARAGIGRPEKEQRVKLPVVVNGRIAQPGETQFFRIDGRAGEPIVAEVTARRLGSPLDSTLRLTDAKGRELAFNDDFEDQGAGLLTHQADSLISCTLPAKGTYSIQVTDRERHGGAEYAYRLRISHPQPDFELRVTPSSLNLRAGSTAPVTVYALRRDGFAGEIALKLKDAPAGFALSGAAVPSGQDSVRLTLTVPRTPVGLPLSIQLAGQATIDGRDVTRIAVPAEEMEQAFAYRHLVAEDAWIVRVIGAGGGVPWRTITKPLQLTPGAATAFDVFVPPRLQNSVRLALNDPPEGISVQNVIEKPNGVSLVLRVEGGKAKPGLKGNLIVDAFREAPGQPGNGNRRRIPLGTLPAIPFEVLEK